VLKRTIRAHTGLSVSKNADILLYLDYVVFMQDLLREASIKARQRGSATISPADVRRVAEMALLKFKG